MKKRRSAGTLSIWQNGQQVGRLSRESTGAIHFQYDDVWLAAPNAFPISLSLPLRNDRFSGDTVLAVFDNLLPDNDRIRRHLAERARAEGQDTFSLLEAIGRDCVGALQFLPEDENPPESGVVNSELLSETDVADLLENLSTAPLGVDVDGDFRISIARSPGEDRFTIHGLRMEASAWRNGHHPHSETSNR